MMYVYVVVKDTITAKTAAADIAIYSTPAEAQAARARAGDGATVLTLPVLTPGATYTTRGVTHA